MAAQVRRDDVVVGLQFVRHPVPVAAVVAPAVYEQHGRCFLVAPVHVVQAQSLREVDVRRGTASHGINTGHRVLPLVVSDVLRRAEMLPQRPSICYMLTLATIARPSGCLSRRVDANRAYGQFDLGGAIMTLSHMIDGTLSRVGGAVLAGFLVVWLAGCEQAAEEAPMEEVEAAGTVPATDIEEAPTVPAAELTEAAEAGGEEAAEGEAAEGEAAEGEAAEDEAAEGEAEGGEGEAEAEGEADAEAPAEDG